MAKFPNGMNKFVGDRVALPPTIGVLIILALAFFVTVLITGDEAKEEAELKLKMRKLEENK